MIPPEWSGEFISSGQKSCKHTVSEECDRWPPSLCFCPDSNSEVGFDILMLSELENCPFAFLKRD